MTRQIFFQIHWFLGITAGLVLAVMGVTGAMMSYEDELMAAFSPGIVTVTPGKTAPLAPDALIARASAQRDGLRVTSLTVEKRPDRAALVVFETPKGKKGRGEASYVDPSSGTLLGKANGEGFFRFVRSLHRWLALPGGGNGIGRQITGFSAIALIYFALSGLYLRWPRRPLDWRSWFVLDLRKTGRNLYRNLHVVIGSWVALFYLLSAFTGLWWSYDWYRQGVTYALTGKTAPAERAEDISQESPGPVALARSWESFQRASRGRFESVRINISFDGKPLAFRALREDARHERMTDEYRIDPLTGKVKKVDLYARRDLGKVITGSMLELHRGAFFGIVGRIVMLLTSLTMPLFTVTGILLYLARRKKKAALAQIAVPTAAAHVGGGGETLIVYASQTGGAERLARQTALAFDGAAVVPLSQLDDAILGQARRALFLISTYGEGDPPDMARGFARSRMGEGVSLDHLDYALMALGDREYPDYCAFGHRVDHWLHARGAKRLFDVIEMDRDDPDAQRQWQQQIVAIGARNDLPDWQPASYQTWRLVERIHLNPGSQGAPAFHIALAPVDGSASDWQAGDIAEISPRNSPDRVSAWLASMGLEGRAVIDGLSLEQHLSASILPSAEMAQGRDAHELVRGLQPLPHREYSIASIPQDGQVHLLVRQVRGEDGALGLGSGWLTSVVPDAGDVALRLRDNPNFRPPDHRQPMIMIGNGTGLAGLRAHLRQRAIAGAEPNWLLLGERSARFDAFHDVELQRYLKTGALTRLDRAWSRDAGCGRYVQDLVDEAADDIRAWVQRGAAIYVCGSIEGMAPAVDQSLRAILGDEALEAMIEVGRYRRDIY